MDVITAHRLRQLDLDGEVLDAASPRERAQLIYETFLARVPYENLSDNRTVDADPDDPESWPRATDRLLRDNAAHGLGGTSFSLAYTLRDLLHGAGVTAHCTLGYNLVTERAHAAVVVYVEDGPLLYDPALLMCGPVPVRPGGVLEDPLGVIRFQPRCGPTLSVTLQMHCGDRRADGLFGGCAGDRAIYSIIPMPAPPHSFRQAWLASFFRGRTMPLRFARRVGERIFRYGERPGSIEILTAQSREAVAVEADAAAHLHRVFGIDEDCLRAWFERPRA